MMDDENRLSDEANGNAALAAACAEITLLVLDVDGVLCDGHAWQDGSGRLRRSFSIRDAIALRRWRKNGYKVAVITAARSDDIRDEVGGFGVDFFIENCDDKGAALSWIRQSEGLSEQQIALFAAGIEDLLYLQRAGVAITSPIAPDDIQKSVDFITRLGAGDGAVAEACGFLLRQKALAARFAKRAGGQ